MQEYIIHNENKHPDYRETRVSNKVGDVVQKRMLKVSIKVSYDLGSLRAHSDHSANRNINQYLQAPSTFNQLDCVYRYV